MTSTSISMWRPERCFAMPAFAGLVELRGYGRLSAAIDAQRLGAGVNPQHTPAQGAVSLR